MAVSLATYSGDRRLCLGGAEAIRRPIYYESWNTIRIGLQMALDGPASSISGTPRWAVGVCHGSTNVLTTSSADHVVCVRQAYSTLGYYAGPPKRFTPSSLGTFWQAYKKVGSSESTTDKTYSSYRHLSADPTIRSGLFIEINKSTKLFGVAWPSSTSFSDLSDTNFQAAMELTDLSSISSLLSGYSYETATATFAIDEATDGALDHLFVFWDRTTHLFTFNLRHRKIA